MFESGVDSIGVVSEFVGAFIVSAGLVASFAVEARIVGGGVGCGGDADQRALR